MQTLPQQAWFRHYRTTGYATNFPVTQRIFCFPHAGGAASFFRSWIKYLPADIELVAVQYPGREDRIGEACVDNLEILADKITNAMKPLLNLPFSLFGHSAGAIIAYEVAQRLENRLGFTPLHLFVSGQVAPQYHQKKEVPLNNQAMLLSELNRLGGTNAFSVNHTDFLELLLPIFQSDYRLIEFYQYRSGPKLKHAITAIIGDVDEEVTIDATKGWSAMSINNFDLHILKGNHFYLNTRQAELIQILLKHLSISVNNSSMWP